METTLKSFGGNVLATLGYWDQTLKSGSALTYARTLLREREKTGQVKEVLNAWRKETAVGCLRQAPAAEPRHVRNAILNAPADIGWTIRLMWVSASRHADVLQAQLRMVAPGVMRMSWTVQKSDRYGERRISKFITWAGGVRIPASYWRVLRQMKTASPELTVHSVRRGAMTFLADQGHEMARIRELSQHTPTDDPNLAVRRYVDPSPNQPESRRQQSMSQELAGAIDGRGCHPLRS